MPALSGDDLVLLRTHPHKFKEYLAVVHPGTVLACQLNGAGGDPVTQINYDEVTEGSYSNVVPDMTLWVGTSVGGRQKGTCRIRKAPTSSILYIAEDSKIDWTDNDHLTVVENYEFWVKYPRVIADGTITVYKDWDVGYSDQHSQWAPVALLGPPDCQFIDPVTGVATVKFVGDRSYAVAPGASLSSYSWVFPSGTPSSSADQGTEASPVEVTWDTSGIYWVSLTVTDSNGKLHSGRRPIFIFERTGTNTPYTRFKMTGRSGSLNQHGHTASFEVHGDADQAEFPDGALVVYFTEDWYGDTQKSIGGNFPYRAHIKFAGYIQRESTTKDPRTSIVKFDAATIDALMTSREGFSCWIKNGGSASNWCQAINLTADRAALSLCRYNSTLLDICDVIPSGSPLKIKSQEFAAKNSILQQLQSLYDSLFAHVSCNKQGQLYLEVDPQMRPVTERDSIAIIVDLSHGDWREKIDLPRPQELKTSFINLAGVYYPGYPQAVVPILSKAPGDAPAYGGTTREISGLILAGQSDGNEKAGLALAYDNNEFPDVPMPMAGMWDIFDIVPQEYVRLSLEAADTKRGIVWTDQKLLPRSVDFRVEETETGRVALVDIRVEKDSYGPAGVDGDYPDEVPGSPTNPAYPPEPTRPPGDYVGTAGPVVASHDQDGCYWSDLMGESWTARNTGLPATAILDLIWDPWWFTKAGNRDPENCILWACGIGFVARSPDAGLAWADKTPSTDPPNTWSDVTAPTASTVTYKQLHGDSYHKDTFYVLVEWQEPDSEDDKWRGWIAKTIDDGLSWTWYALAIILSGSSYRFGFEEGPEGFTPIGEIFWGQESIAQWYDGAKAGCSGTDGYWEANQVSEGGGAPKRARWISLEYPCKMTFDAIQWEYLQWGGSQVGGVTRRIYTSDDKQEWTKVYEQDIQADMPCPYLKDNAWPVSNKYCRFVDYGNSAFGNQSYGDLFAFTLTNLSVGPVEFRPLAMDVDVEDGSRIYITTWEDDELFLHQYAASDLSMTQISSFGAATEAEVASKAYFIVPHSPFVVGSSGFGDTVWVFGRYVTGHLALSIDGGGAFTDKSAGGWDSNHRLGAFAILYDGNTLLAFVNHATVPKLWKSPDQGLSWSDINTMPFNVEFDAMTRCTWSDDELFIGRNAAAAMMAAWIQSPWTGDWTDGTGSPGLPTGGGAISSIIWVG